MIKDQRRKGIGKEKLKKSLLSDLLSENNEEPTLEDIEDLDKE